MARFDIYPMPGKEGRGYVIDVQADLLGYLKTRAVVPLLPKTESLKALRDLNPVFMVEGEPHIMLTQAIATVPVKELRQSVASLSAEGRDEAARALDVLLIGI
jgi:toxin CcdB